MTVVNGTYSLQTILTPNTTKARVYLKDPDFRDSIEMTRQRWTSTAQLAERLWNTAALLLRPDAIAGGTTASIFPCLREHGLIPVEARPVWLKPRQVESLWRYQFNVATKERRALINTILEIGWSVFVLLKDLNSRVDAPATVHLTYLKGTAIVANRKRGHLRTLAGPAVANILSYIHCSDDPIDLLREMAVLFGQREQAEILHQMDQKEDRTEHTLALIRQLERRGPAAPLIGATAQIRATDDGPDPATTGIAPEYRFLVAKWAEIVKRARICQSFHSGERYDGKDAIVPDDKQLSLPLDANLIFKDLGPRY